MSSEAELLALQQVLYTSKNPTRRWLHCTRRDWIMDAINQNPGGRAMEVGPGSGIYLPVLASRFQSVVASDIEEAYLKHARTLVARHPNLEVAVDDITASKHPAHSFDLILCTEVVEHIADSAPAIVEMRRLLKPGGTLILSTPQKYSPLEVAAKVAFLPGIIDMVKLIYREPIIPTGHINLMTETEMRRQIDAAGFKIQRTFKSGVYLPVVAEATGNIGLGIEKWLERTLRTGPLSWLLWTQYYVLKA